MSEEVKDGLREVDGIEVTTLMDNYVDVLLRNSTGVTRPPLAIGGEIPADTTLAEHGLSLLVAVTTGEKTHHLMFDCGYSKVGVPHNVEMLGIDLGPLEVIVLSQQIQFEGRSEVTLKDFLPFHLEKKIVGRSLA